MEVAPRTRIFGAVPNVPETFCTDTPAARPSREREISAIPLMFASLASTFTAEPVFMRRSTVYIPFTTAPSRISASSSRTIFMLGVIATRASFAPMKDATTYWALSGTFLISKLPSRSVMPPSFVPSTDT